MARNPLEDFLRETSCDFEPEPELHKTLPRELFAARLADHYAQYVQDHDFKPGEFVQSKPGLETIITMEKGYPAIMLAMYEPVQHAHSNGQYGDGTFHDCNLLIIGNGRALVVCCNSKTLEPYDGPIWKPGVEAAKKEKVTPRGAWCSPPEAEKPKEEEAA